MVQTIQKNKIVVSLNHFIYANPSIFYSLSWVTTFILVVYMAMVAWIVKACVKFKMTFPGDRWFESAWR